MDYTTKARLSSWPTGFGVGKLCCRINHLWQDQSSVAGSIICGSSDLYYSVTVLINLIEVSFGNVTASILNVALCKQDSDFVKMHWYLQPSL